MSDYGLNFRDTSGYRTDTGVNSWVPYSFFTTNYPQTLGNGLTCGWETAPSGVDARDRSTTNDQRLAGFHFFANDPNTLTVFRADLPATGAYDVGAALGDATGTPPYAYLEVKDTNSSLGVLVNTSVGYNADEFYDASGVKRTSSSDWATNNATVSKTFSTTIARFVLQPGGAVAGAGRLAHLRITTGAGGGGGGGGPFPFFTQRRMTGGMLAMG